MFYTVYVTTNLLNGKYYIGCHKTKILEDGYLGSGKRLKHAIKKYGRENFQSTVIRVFKSEKAMFNYERRLIAKHKSDPDCYNIADGGKGGWQHINNCPKLRAKATKRAIEFQRRPEVRQKMSNKMKGNKIWLGRQHTDAAKKKVGQASSQHQHGNKNSQFGTCWIVHDQLQLVKRIRKTDLEKFIINGWRKGRVMAYGRAPG